MNVTYCRSKLAAQSYLSTEGDLLQQGEQCVPCICVWSRL